ncbi:MAG TPA: glycosyltransferase family 1 protein [Sphingomicrobium sp.]|nr:glycosyltransferase family 1 protein [Sphingomicrobium sp.]
MIRIARAWKLGRRGLLSPNRALQSKVALSDTPRLLVDVSAIIQHDAQTGIQRVVRAVWSELKRRSGSDFIAVPVFATRTAGYRYAPMEFLGNKPEALDLGVVRAGVNDKFLGLDLAAHLIPRYRRQLESWRTDGATLHLVLYDLLPLLHPEWFSAATARNFRKWFEILRNNADHALCISDSVMRDLQQQLERSGGDGHLLISRMQLGADIAASLPTSGITEELTRVLERMRFRPAVLMVGTIEPRKGYDVALNAFEYLWRTGAGDAPDLVILGKSGWKTDALQDRIRRHPELGRRLHWLQGVSDEALCLFYRACRGLLVTSYGEGFGLPILEAASHGCAILARDIPVFREQCIPNITFFHRDEPASLVTGLRDLLAVDRVTNGRAVELPTWRGCVGELLQNMGIGSSGAKKLPALPARPRISAAG